MNKKLKVAYVVDDYKVAINAGADEGIEVGQRYLLYVLSPEEIFDPDTGESLGHLEIVKGIGKVINVQDKLSELESDTYHKFSKKIPMPLQFLGASYFNEESDRKQIPFDKPKIGDLLKRVD